MFNLTQELIYIYSDSIIVKELEYEWNTFRFRDKNLKLPGVAQRLDGIRN